MLCMAEMKICKFKFPGGRWQGLMIVWTRNLVILVWHRILGSHGPYSTLKALSPTKGDCSVRGKANTNSKLCYNLDVSTAFSSLLELKTREHPCASRGLRGWKSIPRGPLYLQRRAWNGWSSQHPLCLMRSPGKCGFQTVALAEVRLWS